MKQPTPELMQRILKYLIKKPYEEVYALVQEVMALNEEEIK